MIVYGIIGIVAFSYGIDIKSEITDSKVLVFFDVDKIIT